VHRKAGCDLVLFARRKEELEKVAAACKQANQEGGSGKGGNVKVVVADMTDRKSIDAVSNEQRRLLPECTC
jgi:3-hydroxy acid dehydrogenase/malonic semialdehyde reductase